MIEKIKENLDKLTFVLSITAAALLVPTILSRLASGLSESVIISLIEYALLLAAPLLFLIPKTDKKRITEISNALFFGGIALANVYNAILGNLASFATALLYIALAVLIFIPKCKRVYELSGIVATAFFLSAALGGGAVNLSILISALIIAANYYFNIEKE